MIIRDTAAGRKTRLYPIKRWNPLSFVFPAALSAERLCRRGLSHFVKKLEKKSIGAKRMRIPPLYVENKS
jgi:hypothetical protein